MNLSELIDTHRGARSYVELSRDCGGAPSAKRLQQIVTGPIRNFPDPPTIEALSRGLRVSHGAVVLASAESLGLSVDQSSPRLFDLLGSSARSLTEVEAGAVAHMVRTFVGSRTVEPEPEAAGEEPEVADVLRARRLAAAPKPAEDVAARVQGEGALDAARRTHDAAGEESQDPDDHLEPQ